MKNMVLSVGTLAMVWAVGYGVQAAAWLQTKVEGEEKTLEKAMPHGRVIRLQRVA